MVFELIDLEQLGEKALQDFARCVTDRCDAEVPMDNPVSALLTKVEFTYAVAARLAHREATMEGTVAIWSKMVALCDQAAKEVQGLHKANATTKASVDRILDLRNAAERRRALHA